MTVNSSIEEKAQQLLDLYRLNSLPVQVEEVVKRCGINLFPFDLGNDVSGVIHMTGEISNIGYNPNESKVRQRFTIAHELGHFVLHYEKEGVFVDNEKYFQFIKFRSTNLSENDFKEKEANAFAAALLMPIGLLKRELENYSGFDFSDSKMINDLAKKFEVSTQAMSYRIINLSDSQVL